MLKQVNSQTEGHSQSRPLMRLLRDELPHRARTQRQWTIPRSPLATRPISNVYHMLWTALKEDWASLSSVSNKKQNESVPLLHQTHGIGYMGIATVVCLCAWRRRSRDIL